jgi:hypothetical protein
MICTKKTAYALLSILFILSAQRVTPEDIHDKNKKSPALQNNASETNEAVFGFGILKRIPGLWSGPVFSSTPAGSFKTWYVDFRPVSPGQVSQYSTLDAQTLNYISFFIVKYGDTLKVAMRTEGVFQNKGCVTYEVADTVRESEGYYRFSDFRAGEKRAYTDFKFRENEFTMEVYTNKFRKVFPLQLHSRWSAARGDRAAAAEAISYFKFPQPKMIKDFTNAFNNMPESIYFEFENDPYSSSSQPHVGNVTVNISIDNNLKVKKNHELCLLLTTESLYEGIKYKKENLRKISRYALLPVGTKSFTFKNVHPGTYYLYAYDDVDNDKKHTGGDYMSSDIHNVFTLKAKGSVTVNTKIDYVIP